MTAETGWEFFAKVLFVCGPIIATCVVCMLRAERNTEKLGKIIVAELRVLGHRTNGLGRAIYIEALTRKDLAPAVRMMIERDLAVMESEDDVKDMRKRAT